ALVQAAFGASRKKGSYLKERFWRLKARRGEKRAAMAVAHSILVAAYEMLRRHEQYRDLGTAYLDRIARVVTEKRLVRRLQLETAHEALLGDNAGDAVEVGSAEVAILFVSTEHFVSGDENAVGNRHGGSFFASTSFQSPEPLLEVAALLARCAEGGLDQS